MAAGPIVQNNTKMCANCSNKFVSKDGGIWCDNCKYNNSQMDNGQMQDMKTITGDGENNGNMGY